jgi:hypothetical protein
MASNQGAAIAAGKVVTLHYTLRDPAGNELDSSATGEPIQYLHGVGMIVPGLEDGLAGKRQGERAKIVVAPRTVTASAIRAAFNRSRATRFRPRLRWRPAWNSKPRAPTASRSWPPWCPWTATR